MSFTPVDDAARERARGDFDTSLVLEAGAGTGKTTLLVDRIESLLTSGRARLDEIAAVTFSENAATTLKLRLRERLEHVRSAGGPAGSTAASAALLVLERAAISTLHAFCAALLQERPLDCGVLPGFRVADEAEADLLFAEAWDEWIAGRLEEGDETILDAMDQEIPLTGTGTWDDRLSLRGLARSLIEQRDLEPLAAPGRPDAGPWRDELLRRATRAAAVASCADADDILATKLREMAEFAKTIEGLSADALSQRRFAFESLLKGLRTNSGDKRAWSSESVLAEGRDIARWAVESSDEWRSAQSAALHARLLASLAGVGTLYASKKSERGVLDFLDLLLRTREALESKPSVRRYFSARYPYLIIDEFQDTDPLQVRIADLLTAGRRGGLVVVGDPKQSIYRFRRADVRLFSRAVAEAASGPGRAVLRLAQNFRSRPAILRFVNRVFGELLEAREDLGQPAYEPITPPPGLTDEPSVLSLRFHDAYDSSELLAAETRAVTKFALAAADGEWTVRDARGGIRPSRAGDVLVLARRLTQIHTLESALEAAGLRHVTEGGKSFFDRQEVNELIAVLRAIDDPADRVALVAALRGSFFGVSDRDIACYVLSGGWLRMGEIDDSSRPGAASLGPALALLESLHRDLRRASPAALVERLYDETRILAALAGDRRGEAQAGNLEKAVALARQAESLGVLTLRGFGTLLESRLRERSEEPDLPMSRPGDPDTVRILTIHKAKGLEAPIVVLYDGIDNAWQSTSVVPLWDEAKIAIGFRKGCQPPNWEVLKNLEEERAKAEQTRLLYVACTRARDWLVVPTPPEDVLAGEFWKPIVNRLPEREDEDVRIVDAGTLQGPVPRGAGIGLRELANADGGDALAARWETQRRSLLEAAAIRPFTPISATRVALREAPPAVAAVDARDGRAFGALVHRVLEWIPLDTPSAARAMAEGLAPSFGLDLGDAQRAADAVVRTLALPVMERARRAPRVFRELPVWLPREQELVEGIVDLAFEEAGGFVVVDYKTDRVPADRLIDQAAHHAPQLRLYGSALAQATGLPVRERLVLFTEIPRAILV
jgi:ATP-dependent exoDNAse (exonuclease V) beta subunit